MRAYPTLTSLLYDAAIQIRVFGLHSKGNVAHLLKQSHAAVSYG